MKRHLRLRGELESAPDLLVRIFRMTFLPVIFLALLLLGLLLLTRLDFGVELLWRLEARGLFPGLFPALLVLFPFLLCVFLGWGCVTRDGGGTRDGEWSKRLRPEGEEEGDLFLRSK
jgi:hypothetical protein